MFVYAIGIKCTYMSQKRMCNQYTMYICWAYNRVFLLDAPCQTPGGGEWRVIAQEAKYVESWPSTTSARAGWSRFDIPMDSYGGVHSLLLCSSIALGSSTCHQASQQGNTYWTKYQKNGECQSTLWSLQCCFKTQIHGCITYCGKLNCMQY